MEGHVLVIVDVTKTFKVETDTFDFMLGGTLLQNGHLIVCESKKLKDAERRFAASKKEMFAVVHYLRA